MSSDKAVEASMQTHYNDAITAARTMQTPFSTMQTPPPSYDDSQNMLHSDSYSQAPAPTRLSKTIAIPATTSAIGSPFLRCYAPVLAHYNLPRDVFLRHLDNLNHVAVASPPLQILNLTGTVVGFVPFATAQIVGTTVSASAGIGTYALSKGRTEMCLRDLNRDIFGPRRLKIEVADTKAVAKLTGMPILTVEGKLDKTVRLLDELEPHEMENVTSQQRRLGALRPWIEELEVEGEVELEAVHVPDSRLSQITARISEKNRAKGDKKMLKERGKAHDDYSKETEKVKKKFEKEMAKLDREEQKVLGKENEGKQQKELAKIEKERAKVVREYEKEKGEVEKDRIKDDKEEEMLRKTKWLIIRDIEADSGTGPNPDIEV